MNESLGNMKLKQCRTLYLIARVPNNVVLPLCNRIMIYNKCAFCLPTSFHASTFH